MHKLQAPLQKNKRQASHCRHRCLRKQIGRASVLMRSKTSSNYAHLPRASRAILRCWRWRFSEVSLHRRTLLISVICTCGVVSTICTKNRCRYTCCSRIGILQHLGINPYCPLQPPPEYLELICILAGGLRITSDPILQRCQIEFGKSLTHP